MSNLNLFLRLTVIFAFFYGTLPAQKVNRITSTGRTTGHIATISVENTTNALVIFELGTAIIPSMEFQNEKGIQKSQPQIHTGNIQQEIAPGETIEIPLNGYCLDVGKPPLPRGTAFPPIGEWIGPVLGDEQVAVPTSPEPVKPVTPKDDEDAVPTSPEPINPGRYATISNELPPSFQPLKDRRPRPRPEPVPPDEMNPVASEWGLSFPGTAIPFNYTIDISEHPEDAAILIFPMVDQIVLTYDSLQNEGLISTPFSQDKTRQREAVIQQTIWVTTSLLQGEDYGKDDFAERMAEQFEESSGVKMDETPEQQQEQFKEGVEHFWNNFELVGEKAKVIRTKASYLPREVTIEEDLSRSFIESTYGKYDLTDVKFSDKNKLVNFDNEKIFLILIYAEEESKKESVWLKLETEKDKWRKMTEDDILALNTMFIDYCSLHSPPDCPTGCKGDNNMRGAGAGVPDDKCIPSDIQW